MIPASFEQWLERGKEKPKKVYRIPAVTKKRAADNRIYTKLRSAYLKEHPYCQITIRYHNLNEEATIAAEGRMVVLTPKGQKITIQVPHSNQIHHSKKPKKTYLNDVSTWFAASPIGHEWVENNKKEARKLGLLENI